MHHALGAAGVFADAVFLPVGLFHHLLETRVMGVGNEIAGGLPALGVPSRIAPGGAVQFLFPLEEAQVHGGGEEAEALAHFVNLLEFLFDVPPLQEELLANGFIAEAGGHQQAVDTDLFQFGEEHLDLHQVRFLEDGGVGTDAETHLFRLLDGLDGGLEGALALQDAVVGFFHAIHVDI